jgi:3-deoxy-manno-octulosonate cytidylyltransferase (CMP-KDO synthetase)
VKAVVIIPARMASSRYPGKPLKKILKYSMIEHVWRRAKMCPEFKEVIIATCDDEIRREAEGFGARVIMTSDKHESCVDRVEEAALSTDADIIVNLQGDMPLVNPESLSSIVRPFYNDPKILYTDMIGPISDQQDAQSSNVVKIVFDKESNALYYSREPLPSSSKVGAETAVMRYKQFGINAYRRESLKTFARLPRTTLEKIESVDMLRLLENGFKVRTVISHHPVIGVDTDADLKKAEEMMNKDPFYLQYC